MTLLAAPPADLLDENAALFLDFDGTLVELAETPDGITVAETLPALLRALSERLGGRLAIVSGRAIGNLQSHVDCAGIAVSGSHGVELRWADGSAVPMPAVDLTHVRAAVERFAGDVPGLVVEEKPAGIAIHYRQAPEEAEHVERFMSDLAKQAGMTLQHGKLVAELRPTGADKGVAVRAFMAEAPFRGARPIFIGDDVTDEHGFEAVAALGGAGILVGPQRDTAALYQLEDVAHVAAWLEGAAR